MASQSVSNPDQGPTVLVVDDEPSIVTICRGFLEPAGYRVIGAGSAAEARRLLEADPVDVVVCDHAMPETTGVDLLAEVRDRWPGVVRILYTGVVDPRIAEEATTRAEVFRFLVKPFPAPVLRNAVDQALAYRRLVQENEAFRTELERMVRDQSRELARTGAFLESLLDALPAGVLAVDGEGTVTRANRAAATILGMEQGQLVGARAEDVGVPCRGSGCAVAEGGGPRCRNRELEVRDRWGLRRQLLWSCEEVRIEEGESGCVASFIDVTEKKDLEIRVFQAKQEIEAVFDSITDPTAVVGRDGRIARANRAFSHMVKRPFEDLLGHALSEVGAPGAPDRVGALVRDVFATGEPAQAEHHDRAGAIFQIRLFPIFKRGRVEQVVIRYQDITAERELEHRLAQSEKMASVGQLAAGIAHEINNPVGFILSNLNRLAEYASDLDRFGRRSSDLAASALDGRMDPREAWEAYLRARQEADLDFLLEDVAEIVADCREGAERIRKIVTDLKTFSHPGGDDWEYADLNRCLESTLNIAWNELKYDCDVERDFGELPQVLCRPQQLNQVFLNLLVNAAHAVKEKGQGRGRVRVTTRQEGDRVVVEISDTGVGIPPEHLRKIFDPFFTTKPVGKGTGLGLHLAAGIVRAHGGEIRVESTPGEGSTFRVVLPLVPPGAEERGARDDV
ncbi:MAG: PAS domain-containing protein [Deltaproteobacteria bacterium]|nr:PAS domain-containing protein [Deltaproteobacteria bacterium]